jgi:hypothetical protein
MFGSKSNTDDLDDAFDILKLDRFSSGSNLDADDDLQKFSTTFSKLSLWNVFEEFFAQFPNIFDEDHFKRRIAEVLKLGLPFQHYFTLVNDSKTLNDFLTFLNDCCEFDTTSKQLIQDLIYFSSIEFHYIKRSEHKLKMIAFRCGSLWHVEKLLKRRFQQEESHWSWDLLSSDLYEKSTFVQKIFLMNIVLIFKLDLYRKMCLIL